jgi:hypothetical protein
MGAANVFGRSVLVPSEEGLFFGDGPVRPPFSPSQLPPGIQISDGDPNGAKFGPPGSLVIDTATPALWQNSGVGPAYTTWEKVGTQT